MIILTMAMQEKIPQEKEKNELLLNLKIEQYTMASGLEIIGMVLGFKDGKHLNLSILH